MEKILKKPLIHTNGFMRFYVNNLEGLHGPGLPPIDEYFIHVWVKSMPNSTPELEIHDHPFSFDSEVLDGSMTQDIIDAIPDLAGNYVKVTPRAGWRLHRLDQRLFRLEIKEKVRFSKGDKYFLDQDSIHRISGYVDGTITKVVRHTDQQHCPVVYVTQEFWAKYSMKDDPKRYVDFLAAGNVDTPWDKTGKAKEPQRSEDGIEYRLRIDS
jgi:hypothetical protein